MGDSFRTRTHINSCFLLFDITLLDREGLFERISFARSGKPRSLKAYTHGNDKNND
jgi:hypothetical protein